jgi:MFS family permease
MGIFGTSESEEAQLRLAAQGKSQDTNSRYSISSATNSSAYETAPEFTDDEDVNIQDDDKKQVHDENKDNEENKDNDEHTIIPSSNINDSGSDHDQAINEYYGNLASKEDVLNRRSTLERVATNRSVQDVADEEFRRSISVHSNKTQHSHDKGDINSTKEEYSEDENTIDVNKLDWDGPDDKGNPHNWSGLKKWWITFTVALVCLCCSLGSSLYVGSVPELVVRFGISTELGISGLTFYMIGLALGPLLTGPLSEKIGRRWIYVISFPIGMLFNLGIGFAKNIRTILVLRFFVGFFCSPALAIASGTISDLWANKPEDLSFAIALFCLAPFLGPVIGPIVGGFAGEYKGWKWPASWVYLMFSGAVLPSLALCPETYKPIILRKRARARGMRVIEPPTDFKKIATFVLLRPAQMLAGDLIISLMSIYVAFIFAVLFGFFEAYPVIFRGVHHMSIGVSGLPFISVGLGLISGVVVYVLLDHFVYFPKNPDGTRGKRDENGNIIWAAPEEKLFVGKIGAVCLPVALFWMGWTGRNENIHWMAPTAAGFPFGLGLILVFFSVVGYFSMAFPPICLASAMSANNVLRYVLASVFPLFTIQMYTNLGIGWASSLFGFISIALLPVPFIFAKIGPTLRARSKYGYTAYFKKIAAEKAAEAAAAAAASTTSSGNETNVGSETKGEEEPFEKSQPDVELKISAPKEEPNPSTELPEIPNPNRPAPTEDVAANKV